MKNSLMVIGDVLDAIDKNPNISNAPSLGDSLQPIINMVIMVVGIIAVVMVIVGGVQYTMSQGDAGKLKKAKDTIMYGIIGMVIALLSFSIVNFVLDSVFKSGSAETGEVEEVD